jgi:ADP-ribose pyrophosphatase YjhB (NUDIX family)
MSNLTLYHGTGNSNVDGFLKEPPRPRHRSYLPKKYSKRPCFCTTKSWRVAGMFAFRKSTCDEFKAGKCGVILEFELDDPTEGMDYINARDHRCMQDEKEVVVFNVRKLTLISIWENHGGEWKRSQRYRMDREAFSRRMDNIFEGKLEDKGDVSMSGTVAVFRVNEGEVEVLVGMRLWDPDKGKLALPGGHLKKGENPEIGALRELEEETGVKIMKAIQVLDRPPEIGRETRDVSFAALLEGDQPLRATSDLANVHWISAKRLPPMAFKDEVIVREALPKVLGKLDLRLASI